MSHPTARPSAGIVLSLPLSLGLIAAFFLPWVEVSCNGAPQVLGAPRAAGVALSDDAPPAPDEPFATASGWQLARGRLEATEAMPFETDNPPEGAPRVPRPRRWVYAGLAMPILMALFALLGLLGQVTPSGAGKGVALFALGGLVCMIGVWSMDYISSDVADGISEEAVDRGESVCGIAMGRAEEMIQRFITTRRTRWFWGALGGYGLTALLGLAAAASPQRHRRPQYQQAAAAAGAVYAPPARQGTGSGSPAPQSSTAHAPQPKFRSSPARATGEMRTPASRSGSANTNEPPPNLGEDL